MTAGCTAVGTGTTTTTNSDRRRDVLRWLVARLSLQIFSAEVYNVVSESGEVQFAVIQSGRYYLYRVFEFDEQSLSERFSFTAGCWRTSSL
jgi:hypothetical protein